jgi:hypothetical protein
MKTFKMFLEDKGSKAHHLGLDSSFAHMKKHALMHVDVDFDGDVDDLEKSAKDELTGEEKPSATIQILKKLDKEIKHSKKGYAFK